uniref:Uncharacterized protein n=1 Tax=Angiostrongylus cantonensis TaxID=6313 RepID=A0A0K0D0X9_ANGCA
MVEVTTNEMRHLRNTIFREVLLINLLVLGQVLRGARTRVRIGANVDLLPVFSNMFYDHVKAQGLKVGSFIAFPDFENAFEATAVKLTHMLSSELITKIRASGLLEFWNDMKLDIMQSYRSALLRGGVSPARATRWRLTQTGASDTDYNLHCEVASVFSNREQVLEASDDVEDVDSTLHKAELELHSLCWRRGTSLADNVFLTRDLIRMDTQLKAATTFFSFSQSVPPISLCAKCFPPFRHRRMFLILS